MNRLSPILLIPILAAVLALVCGLLFLNNGARTADGVPVLALDDSYIHLVYAQQVAQGQFFRYNPGDDPTAGATSLLWMGILALGFGLGLDAASMPTAILLLGLAMFAAAAMLMAAIGRQALANLRNGDRGAAWVGGVVAGGLFATSGWMAWAFFSGMETGLLILLVAGALWALLTRRAALMTAFTALAVLTRPEAVALAVALAAGERLVRDPAETNDHGRRFRLALLPVIIALLPYALNWLLTGSLSAAGWQAKSWFSQVPLYLGRVLGEILTTLARLFGLLFNAAAPDGLWHTLPLALLLALTGGIILFMRGRAVTQRFMLACAGWIVLGAGATATLQTAAWHHYRYQMPLYPALLALVAVGLAGLVRGMTGRLGTIGPLAGRVALAALVLGWGAFSLNQFGAAYALDTGTVLRQQMALADCLRQQTPEDALIAVHDVGVMRFLGQRRTLDVVGLTTPDMARASRNGPGAIYEALEQAQPGYYAIYPDAAPPYFGLDVAADLLGEELCRVAVERFSVYTSATGTQVLTRADWSGAALAEQAQQPSIIGQLAGWTRTDALDVADLDSEDAHVYTWWHADEVAGFPTDVRQMAYREGGMTLTDGGRVLGGGDSFTLATQPGQWTVLAARLHVSADLTLRVQVDGVDAGLWKLPALPGEWLESAFRISPEFIRGTETRFRLTLENAAPEDRYQPYYYWAYAGTPQMLPPAPLAVNEANFGAVARLRGFDLSGRRFAPGDVLNLTLHWLALDPPRGDYKVFVHLMNPADDSPAGILAQHDAAPRSGTYPFWVWGADETVSETVTLPIPADAGPGDYVLLLGVYDAATGERLPVLGGQDFGANRLVLTTITVQE